MSETKKKSKERKNFKINSTSVFCATVVHCEENHYVLKKVVIYGKDEKGMLFEGEINDLFNTFIDSIIKFCKSIGKEYNYENIINLPNIEEIISKTMSESFVIFFNTSAFFKFKETWLH